MMYLNKYSPMKMMFLTEMKNLLHYVADCLVLWYLDYLFGKLAEHVVYEQFWNMNAYFSSYRIVKDMEEEKVSYFRTHIYVRSKELEHDGTHNKFIN